MKKYVFVVITSLIFISRFFLFISTQDVGIEHDSGWYLGVARNVAERGIYASYTNTISTTEKPGGFPSIHNRFSVQDKNGFIYFPAGVTVGPGYVFPEAFFLKLFGYGWTQYRLWPFIAFCLLIPLLFLIVLHLSSFFGLLFFQVWLWFYPQLLLNQSYEALSEHIALLFLLLGYVLLEKTVSSKKIRYLVFSGLFFGLAIQTKIIYVFGVLIPIASLFYLNKSIKIRSRVLFIFLFIFAFCLPTALFEVYRFSYLFSHFGFSGYWANIIDLKRTLITVGSGLTTLKEGIRFDFVYNKLALWKHIGVEPYLFAWPFILFAPLFLRKKTFLFWNVWLSTFMFFMWFAFISPTGWFRHILPGVVMGMIVISVSFSNCAYRFSRTKQVSFMFIFCLFLLQIYFGMWVNQRAIVNFNFTKKQILSLFWQVSPNKMQGPLSHPVFSKKDQNEVVTAIKLQIDGQKRLCFNGGLLVAELPPLVDRVFFPLERCRDGDILVIGPYQKGPLTLLKPGQLLSLINKSCKKIIFSNDSYSLCLIKRI